MPGPNASKVTSSKNPVSVNTRPAAVCIDEKLKVIPAVAGLWYQESPFDPDPSIDPSSASTESTRVGKRLDVRTPADAAMPKSSEPSSKSSNAVGVPPA
jgi:hypothetical protein